MPLLGSCCISKDGTDPKVQDISLHAGLNIVSIPCMSHDYTSYELLEYLGSPDKVTSIQRFDRETGVFETTVYHDGKPSGAEFKITNVESYLIYMKENKNITAPASCSCGGN